MLDSHNLWPTGFPTSVDFCFSLREFAQPSWTKGTCFNGNWVLWTISNGACAWIYIGPRAICCYNQALRTRLETTLLRNIWRYDGSQARWMYLFVGIIVWQWYEVKGPTIAYCIIGHGWYSGSSKIHSRLHKQVLCKSNLFYFPILLWKRTSVDRYNLSMINNYIYFIIFAALWE